MASHADDLSGLIQTALAGAPPDDWGAVAGGGHTRGENVDDVVLYRPFSSGQFPQVPDGS